MELFLWKLIKTDGKICFIYFFLTLIIFGVFTTNNPSLKIISDFLAISYIITTVCVFLYYQISLLIKEKNNSLKETFFWGIFVVVINTIFLFFLFLIIMLCVIGIYNYFIPGVYT